MLKLMGDPSGELTKALDMEMTHPGPASVGIIGRCKRHAIYAKNGVIEAVHVSEGEGDPAGDKVSSALLLRKSVESLRPVNYCCSFHSHFLLFLAGPHSNVGTGHIGCDSGLQIKKKRGLLLCWCKLTSVVKTNAPRNDVSWLERS